MIEAWRTTLYPLGYLATAVFGSRLLLQWLQSESKGRSVVNRSFWQLSLIGNALLMLHSLIQIQFHVCVVQACNAVVAWRNLNLMQTEGRRFSRRFTVSIFLAAICLTVLLFVIQGAFLPGGYHAWFRIPVNPWQQHEGSEAALLWHAVGFAGILLFNSRFWIQWWFAERDQRSYLGPSFWWMSLIGEVLCLAYFLRIGDIVNLIGPAFGMIPYFRNLVLLYRTPKSLTQDP